MALDHNPRRDISHALYTLVMNVAEAASQGHMPDRGMDGLTHLQCDSIADQIMKEIEARPT